MQVIQRYQVINAIEAFLSGLAGKKTEALHKELSQAQEKGDNESVSQIQAAIEVIEAGYDREYWCVNSGAKMAEQLKFGTHISKAIHPDSKGDNVTCETLEPLPDALVGSQQVPDLRIDANSSAAALPLANFLAVEVADNVKIRDLIIADHSSLDTVFANDSETSKRLQASFRQALLAKRDAFVLDEWNKQLFWPATPQAIEEDSYINLIPLHPSSLTHHFNQLIQGRRYSEANLAARTARGNKNAPKSAYLFMPDIAALQLGGSKPQNISQLTSQIRGRNLLMPSLPPLFTSEPRFIIRKGDYSLFTGRLARSNFCKEGFAALFEVVRERQNNVHVRSRRKGALRKILGGVIEVATFYQTQQQPGWSKGYALNEDEVFWLDPQRAHSIETGKVPSEAEAMFKERVERNWLNGVYRGFGRWVTDQLDQEFRATDDVFGDIHSTEWRREIEACAKASQRANQQVFQ
jgi:CRISPR-associated protein Csy1